MVEQGHPDYLDDTLKAMQRRGGEDAKLASELAEARLDNRLDYVEVRARVDTSGSGHEFDGFEYRPYEGHNYKSRLQPPSTEE